MPGGAKRWVVVAMVAVVAIVVAVLAVVLPEDEPDPNATAAAFVAAWSEGDLDRMSSLVVDPATLEAIDPIEVASDIGATETAVVLGEIEGDGDEVRAPFTVTLALGDVGEVQWQGALPLVQVDDVGWRVSWNEQALHPAIPDGGTIRHSLSWPDRAPILGAGDQQLVGPVETIRVGIEPRRFDRAESIPVLADQLDLAATAIEAALDAPGVQPDHFVEIAQLRPEELAAVRDVILPIPGVLLAPGTARGGPTDGFARHLLGRFGEVTAERLEELGTPYRVGDRVGLSGLEAQFEHQLAGEPAVEVRIVDADGGPVEVLASFPGTEPEPLRTTLDRRIQLAAEDALAVVTGPAALVVTDAATGEVRASVTRPLDGFNRAIGGMYPPGSTFKVVTGYALLTHGLALDSPVDCPPTVTVGGRRFRNFEGEAAGTIPFSRAFAQSCNTAFIGAAQELPDGALTEAAATFGFGLDYSLGPTTLGGSFPEPSGAVEEAAAAIGQARVTASPVHMASVAAAVLDGTWRTPVLLREGGVSGGGAGTERVTRPLDPVVRERLAALMRLVVNEGTGTSAQVGGVDLLGKTGTAEFGSGDPPPTHAWFIAAGEGLGAAVVLEGGGVGGRDAAPIMQRFFAALR